MAEHFFYNIRESQNERKLLLTVNFPYNIMIGIIAV